MNRYEHLKERSLALMEDYRRYLMAERIDLAREAGKLIDEILVEMIAHEPNPE